MKSKTFKLLCLAWLALVSQVASAQFQGGLPNGSIPQPGMPPQGYGQPGMPPQGQGYPQQGYGQPGMPPQGYPPQQGYNPMGPRPGTMPPQQYTGQPGNFQGVGERAPQDVTMAAGCGAYSRNDEVRVRNMPDGTPTPYMNNGH